VSEEETTGEAEREMKGQTHRSPKSQVSPESMKMKDEQRSLQMQTKTLSKKRKKSWWDEDGGEPQEESELRG